jgi:hypothetical protein
VQRGVEELLLVVLCLVIERCKEVKVRTGLLSEFQMKG